MSAALSGRGKQVLENVLAHAVSHNRAVQQNRPLTLEKSRKQVKRKDYKTRRRKRKVLYKSNADIDSEKKEKGFSCDDALRTDDKGGNLTEFWDELRRENQKAKIDKKMRQLNSTYLSRTVSDNCWTNDKFFDVHYKETRVVAWDAKVSNFDRKYSKMSFRRTRQGNLIMGSMRRSEHARLLK